MARGDSVSYFSPYNSTIKVHRSHMPLSPSRSPRKPRYNNFRRDLQVAIGWTVPEFEGDFIVLKKFFRSLLDKHFVLDRTGPQQEQEAKRKIKKAIVEKYPDLFEGSKNANKLEEAMKFIKREQLARRGTWARNKRKKEQRRRKALAKESEVQEYMTIEDSDSTREDSDDQAQLRVPAPSSSQSMIYAEPQHPFIRKGSTESPQKQQRIVEPSTSLVSHKPIVVAENQHPFIRKGSIKFPQKQQRIVEFWARPSTSSVSQRLIGTTREVDIPQKSISGPSTPPDARDESPSPNREKSPAEAPRQRLMEFLQTCTPKMDIWYEPLVAFGCDNMPFLEALARWDDKSLEAGLRRVKDQPGIDKTLEGIDVVFLFRNLRKRFQTRG